MYRSHSSLSYDILNGIQFPRNLSVILACLRYFPPPPPVLPGPPPRRSWICTSDYFSFLPCEASDHYHPSSPNKSTPSIRNNHSSISPNGSQISITTPSKSFLFWRYLKRSIQNPVFLILISTILLLIIFLLILLIYLHRLRQRPRPSTNENQKFCYHFIPHRQKHEITTNNNNEHNLVRLGKDSLTPQNRRIVKTSRIPPSLTNETEEAV